MKPLILLTLFILSSCATYEEQASEPMTDTQAAMAYGAYIANQAIFWGNQR